MISILICSANPILLKQFSENVKQNIGVEYELLFFDNQKIGKGICEVYNILADQSKYEYLCFVHEDVLIRTKDWGKILLDIFLDQNIGLIGIAGAKYKSKYFSGWFTGVKALDCANYTHLGQRGEEKIFLNPDEESDIQKVVCIDGVFMCCRKDIWHRTRFNDQLLKGFHFYDLDFSLRALNLQDVIVTYRIDVVHITSGGNFGNDWCETAMLFHNYNNPLLPANIKINRGVNWETRIVKTTLDYLKSYSITLRNRIKWIYLQRLFLKPKFYYSILKFVTYKPLSLAKIHNLFRFKQ